MTRINLIPPEQLHRKHLLAEYRELPRVFALARPNGEGPKQYTMGKGHVVFFYDKLMFLYRRQCAISRAMQAYGYTTSYNPDSLLQWKLTKPSLWNNWQPSEYEIEINLDRLRSKMPDFYV